jgi:hypothetical protein
MADLIHLRIREFAVINEALERAVCKFRPSLAASKPRGSGADKRD